MRSEPVTFAGRSLPRSQVTGHLLILAVVESQGPPGAGDRERAIWGGRGRQIAGRGTGEETAVERENAGDLQRVPPRRQLGAGRRVPVGKGPSTGETYSV